MPMAKQIEVYTLEELKKQFPDAYKRVHAEWADSVAQSGDIAWTEETMDSLKAVIAACGGTLKDWSIGAGSPSSIRVDAYDEYDDRRNVTRPKDAAWLLREVLKPNGYTKKNGHADFPGHCAFTGFCADDDFLESVWKAMKGGSTLTEALEGLADVASRLMEANLDQEQDEETMMINSEGDFYTANGIRV